MAYEIGVLVYLSVFRPCSCLLALRTCVAFCLAFLCLAALPTPGGALPPEYSEGGPGWDDTNIDTAFEPTNRRGPAPVVAGHSAIHSQTSLGVRRDRLQDAAELGSANFQFTVPIIALPGRGLDLALDLIYNSHVLHKIGDTTVYDISADWPGPGWSLGFGKMMAFYTVHKYAAGPWYDGAPKALLQEPDGGRHSYVSTHTVKVAKDFAQHFYTTTDGSSIEYFLEIRDFTVSRGEVRYPDGMVVEFKSTNLKSEKSTSFESERVYELYPTRILDANGNYLAISYRDKPAIASIVDTVGRQFDFHYDTTGKLTAITGPALGGGTRTLVPLPLDDTSLGRLRLGPG